MSFGYQVLGFGSGAADIAGVVATGGDATIECGDYKIHVFTGPGTFCVSQTGCGTVCVPSIADYIVIGGGGGGNAPRGGGAGGGGSASGGIRGNGAAGGSGIVIIGEPKAGTWSAGGVWDIRQAYKKNLEGTWR